MEQPGRCAFSQSVCCHSYTLKCGHSCRISVTISIPPYNSTVNKRSKCVRYNKHRYNVDIIEYYSSVSKYNRYDNVTRLLDMQHPILVHCM